MSFLKHTAKFWMKLFGINFAVGVATGIILEFEFGTNWSNYSWFVGDIFGAPLAIELHAGILYGSHLYSCDVLRVEQSKQRLSLGFNVAHRTGSDFVGLVDSCCQCLDAIPGRDGIQPRHRAQ